MLAGSLDIPTDAVGVVTRAHEHRVIPDRIDVTFPGRGTLIGHSEGDFVEINSLNWSAQPSIDFDGSWLIAAKTPMTCGPGSCCTGRYVLFRQG